MTYSIQRMKVIAFLFVVVGISSWFQFLWIYWVEHAMDFGLEMILLPAGIGLFRRNEIWRKISIALVAIGGLIVVAVPVLGYTISPVMNVRVYSSVLDPNSLPAIVFVVAYVLLLLGCFVWVLFALRDDDVKRFFAEH